MTNAELTPATKVAANRQRVGGNARLRCEDFKSVNTELGTEK